MDYMDPARLHLFKVRVEGSGNLIIKTDQGNDSLSCENEYLERCYSDTSYISITGTVGNTPMWIEVYIDGIMRYRERLAVLCLIEIFIDEETPLEIQKYDTLS